MQILRTFAILTVLFTACVSATALDSLLSPRSSSGIQATNACRIEGQSCVDIHCCTSLFCGTNHRCRAFSRPGFCGGPGASCQASFHCCSNNCVDGKCSSQEKPPPAPTCKSDGETCGTSSDCCSSLYCATGGLGASDFKCHPFKSGGFRGDKGAFCQSDNHCSSKKCIDGKCFGDLPPQIGPDNNVCEVAGQTCYDSSFCCSRNCVNNKCSSERAPGVCKVDGESCYDQEDCCSSFYCATKRRVGPACPGGCCGPFCTVYGGTIVSGIAQAL